MQGWLKSLTWGPDWSRLSMGPQCCFWHKFSEVNSEVASLLTCAWCPQGVTREPWGHIPACHFPLHCECSPSDLEGREKRCPNPQLSRDPCPRTRGADARQVSIQDLSTCYCFLCFSWHTVLKGEATGGTRRTGTMLTGCHLISITISAAIRSCTKAAVAQLPRGKGLTSTGH